MANDRITAIALAAIAATIISAAPSAYAASFDGSWSVVVNTTNGHCGTDRYGLDPWWRHPLCG